MTLNTRVRVYDPVPARELFDECRRLLGASDRVAVKDDWGDAWKVTRGVGEADHGRRHMCHAPAQGLMAWLGMDYAVERPLPSAAQQAQGVEWEMEAAPEHFASVSFDTTYGYQAPNGAGCSDLHAWLVRELGRWLTERGKRFSWLDECRGDWHEGLEGLELLGDADLGALAVAV